MKNTNLVQVVLCTAIAFALLSTQPVYSNSLSHPFSLEAVPSTPLTQTSVVKNWVVSNPDSTFLPSSSVAIIVNAGLYTNSAVHTAVHTYQKDLNNTGYTTILYTNSVPDAPTLRTLLQNWYYTNNLVGAILIGELPFIRFVHPLNGSFSADLFSCDLYFMDLDGNWFDTDSNGVYDRHNASHGADIYPEIYIGRIDASTRTFSGQTNADAISMLLNRVHTYRVGGVKRSHHALTYIDDDWQPWADGTLDNWPAWLNNAYVKSTHIHTPPTWTNATDWLTNRLTQDYEWAHLCVHSEANPGRHYFGPGGSGEGTVSAIQIQNQGPAFNFYNLFCCHGADWLTTDCLATTYLFSGNHSLAVIASTKTGGMLGGTSFYNALGQNETLGKALETWFQGIKSYDTYYLEWFYGMSLLGDPFLTTHYDITALPPTISSITHPTSSQWYCNPVPQFNWTIPPDVNDIAGYYFILDRNATTVPTAATGSFTTVNGTKPLTPLSNGTWYLHVVTKDTVGNIGSLAAHYQVNIIPLIHPPPIPGFPFEALILGAVLAITLTIIRRRKVC